MVSPISESLWLIKNSPEFQSLDNIQKIDFITKKETALENLMDTNYEGGFDKYRDDNPEEWQKITDFKKGLFNRAQDDITMSKSDIVKHWASLEADANTYEGIWLNIGRGGLLWGAKIARALGNEEAAKKIEEDERLLIKGWRGSFNKIAESITEQDPITRKVGTAMYRFLEPILPFMDVTDKNVAEAMGESEKFYHPYQIAGMMGEFTKVLIIDKALMGAPVVGAFSRPIRFGLSTAINHTVLNAKPREQNIKDFLLTGVLTAVSLYAGSGLSHWAMTRPLIAKTFGSLPTIFSKVMGKKIGKFAADKGTAFVGARMADLGESVANSAAMAVQTGNVWDALKTFPAAVLANFVEEIAIDWLPGQGTHKLGFNHHRMHQLKNIENGINKRISAVQQSPGRKPIAYKALPFLEWNPDSYIKSLEKSCDRIHELYMKREKEMQEYLDTHKDEAEELIQLYPDVFKNNMNKLKAEGYTDVEATETALAMNAMQKAEDTGNKELINKATDGVSQNVEDINNQILDNVAEQAEDVTDQLEAEDVTDQLEAEDVTGQVQKRDAIDVINELYEKGEITAEEHQKEVEFIKQYQATNEGFTGGGMRTFNALVNTIPGLADVVSVTETGKIKVDVQAWEKIRGEKYKGQPLAGRFDYVDGKYLVEFAFGAPTSTGVHEFWHFVENALLNNEEVDVLRKAIGNSEKRADAFVDFYNRPETNTRVGQIFNKIKDFFTRVKNFFTGAGFENPQDIFSGVLAGNFNERVANKQAIATHYAAMPRKGFLTKDGYVQVYSQHEKEVPNWRDKGYIRFSNNIGQRFYEYNKLDPETTKLIESDMDKFEPGSDAEFILQGKDGTFVIDIDQYEKANFNLRRALERPKLHTPLYHAIEQKTPGQKADEDIKRIHQYPSFWEWAKSVPFKIPKSLFTSPKDEGLLHRSIEMLSQKALDYPEYDKVYQAEQWRENEGAKRREKYFLEDGKLKTYFHEKRTPESQMMIDNLINESNLNEKLYSVEELRDKGLNQSEIAAYMETREVGEERRIIMMNDVQQTISDMEDSIKRLQGMGLVEDNAIIKGLRDSIAAEKEVLEGLEKRKDKYYFPREWNIVPGDYTIQVDMNRSEMKEEDWEILADVEDILGHGRFWTNSLHNSNGVKNFMFGFQRPRVLGIPFDVGFIKARVNNIFTRLKKAGFNPTYKKITQDDTDVISPEARRFEHKEMLNRLMSAIENKDEALATELKHKYDVMQQENSFARHMLKREGWWGFDIKNNKSALSSYISGHIGYRVKKEAAGQMYDALDQMPRNKNGKPKQPQLFKGVKDTISDLLHNAEEIDRQLVKVTSFLFANHLGFDPKFTFRNWWQNFTKTVGIGLGEYGISPIKGIAYTAQAWKDVRFSLYRHFWHGNALSDAEKTVSHIHNLKKDEFAALIYMIEHEALLNSDIQSQMMSEVNKSFKTQFEVLDFIRNKYGTFQKLAGQTVSPSDKTNRLIGALAYYRLLRNQNNNNWMEDPNNDFDMEAAKTASKISTQGNVDYMSANTPALLGRTSKFKMLRPLFQFNRFLWNFVSWEARFAKNAVASGNKARNLGAFAYMALAPALLVGSAALPFWERLKQWLGWERSFKDLRAFTSKTVGGNESFMKFIDQGLFGFVPGVDMSQSMGIHPLSVLDPLFGHNALFGTANRLKYTMDDVKRGRLLKAVAENPLMPGVITDAARAMRVNKEGIRTFRGDIILDMKGKPLRLNAYETFMYSMGFIPSKMGQYYKANEGTMSIKASFSRDKSYLASKYKMAYHGNKEDLREIEIEIREFNRELSKYKTKAGVYPVPPIKASTKKAWRKGAGNKQIRKMADYYNYNY